MDIICLPTFSPPSRWRWELKQPTVKTLQIPEARSPRQHESIYLKFRHATTPGSKYSACSSPSTTKVTRNDERQSHGVAIQPILYPQAIAFPQSTPKSSAQVPSDATNRKRQSSNLSGHPLARGRQYIPKLFHSKHLVHYLHQLKLPILHVPPATSATKVEAFTAFRDRNADIKHSIHTDSHQALENVLRFSRDCRTKPLKILGNRFPTFADALAFFGQGETSSEVVRTWTGYRIESLSLVLDDLGTVLPSLFADRVFGTSPLTPTKRTLTNSTGGIPAAEMHMMSSEPRSSIGHAGKTGRAICPVSFRFLKRHSRGVVGTELQLAQHATLPEPGGEKPSRDQNALLAKPQNDRKASTFGASATASDYDYHVLGQQHKEQLIQVIHIACRRLLLWALNQIQNLTLQAGVVRKRPQEARTTSTSAVSAKRTREPTPPGNAPSSRRVHHKKRSALDPGEDGEDDEDEEDDHSPADGQRANHRIRPCDELWDCPYSRPPGDQPRMYHCTQAGSPFRHLWGHILKTHLKAEDDIRQQMQEIYKETIEKQLRWEKWWGLVWSKHGSQAPTGEHTGFSGIYGPEIPAAQVLFTEEVRAAFEADGIDYTDRHIRLIFETFPGMIKRYGLVLSPSKEQSSLSGTTEVSRGGATSRSGDKRSHRMLISRPQFEAPDPSGSHSTDPQHIKTDPRLAHRTEAQQQVDQDGVNGVTHTGFQFGPCQPEFRPIVAGTMCTDLIDDDVISDRPEEFRWPINHYNHHDTRLSVDVSARDPRLLGAPAMVYQQASQRFDCHGPVTSSMAPAYMLNNTTQYPLDLVPPMWQSGAPLQSIIHHPDQMNSQQPQSSNFDLNDLDSLNQSVNDRRRLAGSNLQAQAPLAFLNMPINTGHPLTQTEPSLGGETSIQHSSSLFSDYNSQFQALDDDSWLNEQ